MSLAALLSLIIREHVGQSAAYQIKPNEYARFEWGELISVSPVTGEPLSAADENEICSTN